MNRLEYNNIPIEVVYKHILSYLDFKTLYLMKNDNYISMYIYNIMYERYSNKEKVLTALELEDIDLLSLCISQWPTVYDDVYSYKDKEFLLDVFDIARNMRSMKMIYLLLQYKGYLFIGYGRHLRYDIEMICIMLDDPITKDFITNHIITTFIPPNLRHNLRSSVIDYIRRSNIRYSQDDNGRSVAFHNMTACVVLAIVMDIDISLLCLDSQRSTLIKYIVERRSRGRDIFSSVASYNIYDHTSNISDRKLFSIDWYNEYIASL